MVMGPSSRTFLRLKQCASLHATFILIVVVGSNNATLELRICAFEFLTISVSYDVRTTSWFLQRTLLSVMNSTTPLAFVKCNTVHLPPIMIPFYISAKDHPTTFRFMSCFTVLAFLSGDGSINIAYSSLWKSSPETWQWLGKNAGLGCETSLLGGDGEEDTGAVEA